MYHLSQFIACLVFGALMATHLAAKPQPKAEAQPQPEPFPLCDCGRSNLLATMDGRPRTMCSHQAHRHRCSTLIDMGALEQMTVHKTPEFYIKRARLEAQLEALDQALSKGAA